MAVTVTIDPIIVDIMVIVVASIPIFFFNLSVDYIILIIDYQVKSRLG